jgi:hypothetical protein
MYVSFLKISGASLSVGFADLFIASNGGWLDLFEQPTEFSSKWLGIKPVESTWKGDSFSNMFQPANPGDQTFQP